MKKLIAYLKLIISPPRLADLTVEQRLLYLSVKRVK
jgi:hypothetical protein